MPSWMGVSTHHNFLQSQALGFSLQGFKARHVKKVMEMRPGDRLVYYLKGKGCFAGISEVTSMPFEDHTPIWTCDKKPHETYPWRVETKPLLILPEPQFLQVNPLIPELTFHRHYAPPHWRLAFQGNLHRLPDQDMDVIQTVIASAKAFSPLQQTR